MMQACTMWREYLKGRVLYEVVIWSERWGKGLKWKKKNKRKSRTKGREKKKQWEIAWESEEVRKKTGTNKASTLSTTVFWFSSNGSGCWSSRSISYVVRVYISICICRFWLYRFENVQNIVDLIYTFINFLNRLCLVWYALFFFFFFNFWKQWCPLNKWY